MNVQVAFQGFSDPYAWLVRGLIEYGWEDMSLHPRTYPMKTGQGLDLSHLADPLSKYGVRLVVLARDAEGKWNRRDETYEFEVRWVKNLNRQDCLFIRSDEMAYSALFPIPHDNPLYPAGYVHEAITKQTIEFTERRKRGERVSSMDLQEMLNFPLIAPSLQLQQFLQERIRYGRDFNSAHQEGLWFSQQQEEARHRQELERQQQMMQQAAAPTIPAQAQQPPPQYHPQPQPPPQQRSNFRISEGLNRGQLLRGGGEVAGQELSAAMVIVEKAGWALQFQAGLAMFLGLLAVVNAAYTVYMTSARITIRDPDSYLAVIIVSALLGFLGIIGGWAAWACNQYYAEVTDKPYAWVPLIFSAVYPLTFFVGIPIAAFAVWKWNNKDVRKFWMSRQRLIG